MVIIAAGYSSDRMSTIDARYSGLLDKDVKALQNVTLAQAHNNKFGLFLYKEIAELNPDRMRVIDADIDQSVADFHAALNEAKRRSPDLTSEIDAAAALFDREVAESRLGVWKRTLPSVSRSAEERFSQSVGRWPTWGTCALVSPERG